MLDIQKLWSEFGVLGFGWEEAEEVVALSFKLDCFR